MGAPSKAPGGEHMDTRAGGRIERTSAHKAGSKCGKHRGLGVAHLDVFSDGCEHRDAQVGEGGVGINLRGRGKRRHGWGR
eukprot:scaffold17954_cov34-Isochrysis_galbana.AAC.1